MQLHMFDIQKILHAETLFKKSRFLMKAFRQKRLLNLTTQRQAEGTCGTARREDPFRIDADKGHIRIIT